MKRGLALIIILSLLITMISMATSAAEVTKKFEGMTLKVFANSHEPMLKVNQWAVGVMKEKYGVTVLMDQEPYGTQYNKAMTNFIAHTGQYDVIVAAMQWTGGWVDAGFIVPLDEYIAKDPSFDPSVYVEKAYTTNSTYEGKQIAVPFNMEGRLMFYRKDIFEKEGLSVPTNRDEWLKIVKYFYNNPKYPDFYGACYMYGAQQGPNQPIETYWDLFDWNSVKTENGLWDDNMQNCLDKDAMIKALNFWKEAKQYMPQGVEAFELPEAYQFYIDGNCAMTEVWPLTLYGMLLDPANAELKKNTGTADIALGIPMSGGWGLCISADSKVKDLAWEYCKLLASPEVDFMGFKEFGKGPSCKATYADPSLKDQYGDWLIGQQKALAKVKSYGKTSLGQSLGDYKKIVNRAEIGQITAEEAVPRMDAIIDDVLEAAGYKQNK